MRPATEFRITKYRYSADGAASQNSSVLDLAKGALRMITGLIGQTNSSGYAIVTPTATMGIRGTDHEPAYQPPGASADKDQPPGTYDKVNEGETFIRNEKGQQVTVNRGRVAFMSHDRRTAPRLLQGEPKFYRRHAEIDRRTAARREALHRRIQEQRQLRQQERKEKKQQHREDKKAAADHREPQHNLKAGAERDKSEREARQQKQQELREQRRKDLEQRRHEKAAER